MPRVNIGKPAAQLKIEQELRARYGNRINKTQVAEYLGKNRYTVRPWMQALPAAEVNGNKRLYTPERVARAIYERGEAGAFE